MQHFLSAFVSEAHLLHFHQAVHSLECHRAARIVVLQFFVEDFAGAFQPGNRLRDLRADGYNLKDRSNQESQENIEGKKCSQGHAPGNNFVRANFHNDGAHHSHEPRRGETHERCRGQCLQYIVEQALHAMGEHSFFTLLRVIPLHHAHAAQGFREPPGDFSGNFGPCAKNGTDCRKRFADAETENQQDPKCHRRHQHAGMNQVHQGDGRGHQAAHKLHQPRADQIAHAFHVAHDPRHEHTRLVCIVESNRQPADVRLHFPAQLGDHFLRRLRKQLRQRERGQPLNDRGAEHSQHDGR